jgi:hypothetical protein
MDGFVQMGLCLFFSSSNGFLWVFVGSIGGWLWWLEFFESSWSPRTMVFLAMVVGIF